MSYVFRHRASLAETRDDPDYVRFLPLIEEAGATRSPGAGMSRLPMPPSHPFAASAPLVSLMGLASHPIDGHESRRCAVSLRIQLSEPQLVGGICFGGYPYLPHRIMGSGESSANFGLPREVRLSCLGTSADAAAEAAMLQYLDAETAVTRQEPATHAGLQFLLSDPTYTSTLHVRLSDFPRILTKVRRGDSGSTLEERFGFLIPYFYVFAYREGTRYRPHVRGGLIGARPHTPSAPAPQEVPPTDTVLVETGTVEHSGESQGVGGPFYHDFTAASVFGQQRAYEVEAQDAAGQSQTLTLHECFVSAPIRPGDGVTLYVAQAEEYERCIAGLRLLLPFIPEVELAEDLQELEEALATLTGLDLELGQLADLPRWQLEAALRRMLGLPRKVNFCEKIGIRVYELDPPEGVSPLLVPLEGKHSTLLAERTVDELSEILQTTMLEGLRFKRPSHARHFAVQLINRDEQEGQFVVKRLQLVQSAHVTVHPRPTRSLQVRALNFRIVGADLAGDYALLGDEGFNLTVERLVAGEPKGVLFQAFSLIDLLHTGIARIHGNTRRRAAEFEVTEHGPWVDQRMDDFQPDYDARFTEVRQDGWRRTETGADVDDAAGAFGWTGDRAPARSFESYGNQETRTHTEFLVPDTTTWNQLRGWFNFMGTLSDLDLLVNGAQLVPPPVGLGSGFSRYWRGLPVPTVQGLKQIVASPIAFTEFSSLSGFFQSPSLVELLNVLNNHTNLLLLPLAGGVNSGIGFSAVLVSGNLGINPFPMLNHQATVGSQGTVTKQASRTGYSFSQNLEASYAEGTFHSRLGEGRSKRIVARREVPGADERVRGVEVVWQGQVRDIVTGAIPLNFTLPATAGRMHYPTADDSLRVRLGSGVGRSLSVDIWFDVVEEVVKDDY